MAPPNILDKIGGSAIFMSQALPVYSGKHRQVPKLDKNSKITKIKIWETLKNALIR